MPAPFRVWGHKIATCTQRVLFTAEEVQAPIELIVVDVMAGENKTADYLKRQPFGKIPAAEFDGVSFYESRAISRVLAEQYSSVQPLLGANLKEKAIVEQWLSLELGNITPHLEQIVFQRVFKKWRGGESDESAVEKHKNEVQTALKVLDDNLIHNEYVAGKFSLVDIFLAPYFRLIITTNVGEEIFEKYPNIAKWWSRVSARPAWQKIAAESTHK